MTYEEKRLRRNEMQRLRRQEKKKDPEFVKARNEAERQRRLRIKADPVLRQKRNRLSSESAKRMYALRKNDPEFREKESIKAKKYRDSKPVEMLVNSLKYRARKQGIPFNLNAEDINNLTMGDCPITKQKMIPPWKTTDRYDPNKASIDKLVPDLGYVVGNIMWLSLRGNMLKNNHTLETIKATLEYIITNTRKK